KGGLERILRVLLVLQCPPANAPDKRPMPLQEHGERGFVAARSEAFQQLPVAARVAAGCDQFAEMPQQRAGGSARHGNALGESSLPYCVRMMGQESAFFHRATLYASRCKTCRESVPLAHSAMVQSPRVLGETHDYHLHVPLREAVASRGDSPQSRR